MSVLLGQASGFEGFVSVEVLLAAHNLAVADGEVDRQVPVGRRAARPAHPGEARPRIDAVVAGVDASTRRLQQIALRIFSPVDGEGAVA